MALQIYGKTSQWREQVIEALGGLTLRAGGDALETTATTGFLLVPSCPGVPTGVPADIPAGAVPLVFDSAGVSLYAYTGGAWISL